MKKLLLLLVCAWSIKLSIAQIPISHLPKVTYTASSGGSTSNLKDFDLCSIWNSGTYGGVIRIDLNDTIQVTSMNWWIDASPGGYMDEKVEVTLNGTTWIQVANTSGYHYQNEEKILLFDTAPLNNVRYIRITQSNTPSWFSIREFVVNKAYYINNVYSGMPPKILNINEQLVNTNAITSFPTTVYCSKAATYQWKKNGVILSGKTDQSLLITSAGSYTCDITYANGCNILYSIFPLTLTSFEASKKSKVVELKWHTENEINTDKFIIERANNDNDFKQVGIVKSNNTIANSYTYNDNLENIEPKTLYYRLKQVDKDGKFNYSKLVSVKLNKTTNAEIYPNPIISTGSIKLQSEHAESVQVKIVNSEGKVLSTKAYNLTAGNNQIPLNTSGLTSGIYAVVIAGQNVSEHLTFSKQ